LEAKYEADKKRNQRTIEDVSDEDSMHAGVVQYRGGATCTANITANTAKEHPRQKALAITARRKHGYIRFLCTFVIMSRKTQYYNENADSLRGRPIADIQTLTDGIQCTLESNSTSTTRFSLLMRR